MNLRLAFLAVFCALGLGLCALPGATASSAAEPLRGHQASVTVSAETRLDWVFALANQSPAEPPANWLPNYESTQQRYELFVPPGYRPKISAPVILFVSPGQDSAGWSEWQPVCEQAKAIFASPYGAGNDCPQPRRVRIVLDVLDDLRRNYSIDPDRTYLSGFSGGGRIACGIAFALPEYFGGVAPICAAEDLREEPWLRHRVIDRLSVALITGDGDFNRGELERFRGPFFEEVGIRSKVWVCPKLGHAIPDSGTLQEAYQWLESAAGERKKLARRYPAMRVAGDAAMSREAWSKALLAEAQGRIKDRKTLFSGLMQLQGLSTRWNDLQAAETARKTLAEYDAKAEHPWEEDDLTEQRRFLTARARSLDAYASGPLPEQYAPMRSDMAAAALALWKQVVQDSPDSAAGREGAKRIPELEKLIAKDQRQ